MRVLEDLQFEVETQSQPICILLHPQNDTILEIDEYFHLQIVADPPVNTSLSSLSTASVIILDDDSKMLRLNKSVQCSMYFQTTRCDYQF